MAPALVFARAYPTIMLPVCHGPCHSSPVIHCSFEGQVTDNTSPPRQNSNHIKASDHFYVIRVTCVACCGDMQHSMSLVGFTHLLCHSQLWKCSPRSLGEQVHVVGHTGYRGAPNFATSWSALKDPPLRPPPRTPPPGRRWVGDRNGGARSARRKALGSLHRRVIRTYCPLNGSCVALEAWAHGSHSRSVAAAAVLVQVRGGYVCAICLHRTS